VSAEPPPSARQIITALGGKWSGNHGQARCPAHEDKNPSLTVTQAGGKVLVYCHAQCTQEAVLDALRARRLWPEKRQQQVRRIDSAVARRRDVASIQAHARQVMAEFYKRRGSTDSPPEAELFSEYLARATQGLRSAASNAGVTPTPAERYQHRMATLEAKDPGLAETTRNLHAHLEGRRPVAKQRL